MKAGWIVGAAVLGLLVGGGGTLLVIRNASVMGRQGVQGWAGNDKAGSTAADPMSRAFIARAGLLALNRSETIYFDKGADERGRPLNSNCAYELTGGPLPARWWSVTIYDKANYLPVNGDKAESDDATRTVKDAAGRWTVRISPTRDGAQDWISSRNAGPFVLTLRLYNPEPSARDHVDTIPFPTIRTLKCQEAAQPGAAQ